MHGSAQRHHLVWIKRRIRLPSKEGTNRIADSRNARASAHQHHAINLWRSRITHGAATCINGACHQGRNHRFKFRTSKHASVGAISPK